HINSTLCPDKSYSMGFTKIFMRYSNAVIITIGKKQILIPVRRDDLNGTAVIHIQSPLYNIKHMGAPVGHISSSEFFIIAPLPPELIFRCRDKLMIVLVVKVGTQPEVPVQPFGNWLARKAVRSRRAAHIYFNLLDFTDIA